MLTGSKLSVVRQKRALVSEVDFTARPGELTVILGRNGAGKSTLLRCLSGELKPTSGVVSLFDRTLPNWKLSDLAKVRAVVTQSNALSFPFKVREVVELGRGPHRGSNDAVVDWAMEQLDLLPLHERDYTTLSGGERQRTHFARALAQMHEALNQGHGFLLLDEPTSSLDLAHQHQALRCAKALTNRGLGVVAVLHDLNLCAKYANTAYLLDEGICWAHGPVDEVLNPALLSRAYRIPIQKAIDVEIFDVKA